MSFLDVLRFIFDIILDYIIVVLLIFLLTGVDTGFWIAL